MRSVNGPYASAVSKNVTPPSNAARMTAIPSWRASSGTVADADGHAAESKGGHVETGVAEGTLLRVREAPS